MISTYLHSVRKQFEYYKSVGDKTFAQLEDDDFFHQEHEDVNSIAIIVQHLWGNMLSRWTEFLTTDGEKSWRKRDQEFEKAITSRKELEQKWNEAWNCLFDALATINEENFNTIIYIRSQEHTVIDAINRQLSHYPFHIGQIVHIAKEIRKEKWKSLSIPKGKSDEFNQIKQAQGKHGGHFSDDLK